jgi:hypothetical protein
MSGESGVQTGVLVDPRGTRSRDWTIDRSLLRTRGPRYARALGQELGAEPAEVFGSRLWMPSTVAMRGVTW